MGFYPLPPAQLWPPRTTVKSSSGACAHDPQTTSVYSRAAVANVAAIAKNSRLSNQEYAPLELVYQPWIILV